MSNFSNDVNRQGFQYNLNAEIPSNLDDRLMNMNDPNVYSEGNQQYNQQVEDNVNSIDSSNIMHPDSISRQDEANLALRDLRANYWQQCINISLQEPAKSQILLSYPSRELFDSKKMKDYFEFVLLKNAPPILKHILESPVYRSDINEFIRRCHQDEIRTHEAIQIVNNHLDFNNWTSSQLASAIVCGEKKSLQKARIAVHHLMDKMFDELSTKLYTRR